MDEQPNSSGLFVVALVVMVAGLMVAGGFAAGGWIYLRRHEAYERQLPNDARMAADELERIRALEADQALSRLDTMQTDAVTVLRSLPNVADVSLGLL